MKWRHQSRGDPTLIAVLDALAILGGLAIMLFVMAVVFVNKPPKDVAERRTPTEPVPLYVQVSWTYGAPHDVDTWMRCRVRTQDGEAVEYVVGYKQRHHGFLDLVWDDLGKKGTPNFEKIVGNIFVGILVTLVVASFFYNIFLLLFRDGVGASLNSGRGNIYMYDWKDI